LAFHLVFLTELYHKFLYPLCLSTFPITLSFNFTSLSCLPSSHGCKSVVSVSTEFSRLWLLDAILNFLGRGCCCCCFSLALQQQWWLCFLNTYYCCCYYISQSHRYWRCRYLLLPATPPPTQSAPNQQTEEEKKLIESREAITIASFVRFLEFLNHTKRMQNPANSLYPHGGKNLVRDVRRECVYTHVWCGVVVTDIWSKDETLKILRIKFCKVWCQLKVYVQF